jgi:hypothetical protein
MPSYFPENNTAQWGDSAERSLQKISDLLKNGDVPIRINSVAVTGPFTVNNEVEITNDAGNPLPVSTPPGTALTTISSNTFIGQYLGSNSIQNTGPASPTMLIGQFPSSPEMEQWIAIVATDVTGSFSSSSYELRWANGTTPLPNPEYYVRSTRYTDPPSSEVWARGEIVFMAVPRGLNAPAVQVSVPAGPVGGSATLHIYRAFVLPQAVPEIVSLPANLLNPADNTVRVSDAPTQDRIGATNSPAATTDSATSSLNGLFKRSLAHLTSLIDGLVSPTTGAIGSRSDSAAANASAFSTVVGILKGFWQTLLDRLPASVSNQVPVTDNVTANRIGDGNTSMASADNADSPVNGLLKRILWQIQNFLNRFPSALGPQTSATSLSTVLSSDHPTISVSGPLTNTELRLNPVAVSGPLTDTELRANPVPVSFGAAQPVSGPLTNTELRANPVNVDQVNRFNFVGGAGTTTLISQEVVPANASRNYFLFQNLSEQPVYLSFNGSATLINSLRIDGGGAVVFDSGIVPTNQIQVLGTAAGSNYYYLHA